MIAHILDMTYSVVRLVPITNENSVVTRRVRERNRNPGPAKDSDASECTSSLMECERREVIETTNLIFNLEHVSEVPSWGNWASCSIHTVFIGVPPVLNSIPETPTTTECYLARINIHIYRNLLLKIDD